MNSLIEQQRNFFNTRATIAVSYRIEQLKKLKKILQQNEAILCEAIYKDFQKSEFDTITTELVLLYQEIKEAIANLTYWASKKSVKTNLLNFPAKSYIIPEPYGVCLVIGAWNYPYQLSFGPMIAAMAAGNTVVLKPSELPQETSKVIHQLITENFDQKYLAVVQGGVSETTELLQQAFDKIFFTGSTKVGKIVYKAASENLTPVTLELGGKSPAIVTPSCHIKMTVKRLVWGKFLNAGQTCIAPDYVLVHDSIASKFLEACKEEIEKAKYRTENNNYVQIINSQNFERLKKLIDPKKVYFGGTCYSSERIIDPTILHPVAFSDPIMQEEIFGPLLPVLLYSDIEEAIQQVKTLPKPLACYVFSNKAKEQKKIENSISFGGGAINDTIMHITNPNLPFGGVGQSGIGSYHGEFGFKTFSHYKSILHKYNWLEFPLKYSPITSKKLWWVKQIFKL